MNKQLILSGAMLTKISGSNKSGSVKTQIRVEAVLNSGEQKKLHVPSNGFKGHELDKRFEVCEVKLIPPAALKHHQLALSADRAANFKIREKSAEEGKPNRHILSFTLYAEGEQHEALAYMGKLGDAGCRIELTERQGSLLEPVALQNGNGKRGRGRPRKDGKQRASGERDDDGQLIQ